MEDQPASQRHQQQALEGVEDHAMSTASGEEWRRPRRAFHPAFTEATIEGYRDRVIDMTATGDPSSRGRKPRNLPVHRAFGTIARRPANAARTDGWVDLDMDSDEPLALLPAILRPAN